MSRRSEHLLIEDMLDRIGRIERYVHGMDQATFLADEKTIDSVVRNLEVIGEAANRLGSEFHDRHPSVPWRRIIGLRHRIVHDYFEVDVALVWEIVRTELSGLRNQLSALRQGDDSA
jgi:uncharacterized protein with HEPN domain